MVTRNRCAALYVQQSAVPGITNLTGAQAEGIDLRLIARRYIEKTGPGALQVSPVALCFQTEDPGTGLPSIANLAACDRAASVMATFGRIGRSKNDAGRVGSIPAFVAPATAAVDTDVEAAPVIDRRYHLRGRLCVGR